MNQRFSIGDVSKIFDISIQSLRHYHKIGLIVPNHINEDNGYRYYTFDQFHYISRFKYLRDIGLSLDQIKHVLSTGKPEDLKQVLSAIRLEKEKELQGIMDLFSKIDFMNDYYSFNSVDDMLNLIYKKECPERHFLRSDPSAKTIEDMDISLHKKLYEKSRTRINYMRQFSYVIDFDALKNNNFKPLYTCVQLNDTDHINTSDIVTLPAGHYVCFCTRLLTETFDIRPLLDYINKRTGQVPSIVIALEFEEHLHEYYNAVYEIQLFYPPVHT